MSVLCRLLFLFVTKSSFPDPHTYRFFRHPEWILYKYTCKNSIYSAYIQFFRSKIPCKSGVPAQNSSRRFDQIVLSNWKSRPIDLKTGKNQAGKRLFFIQNHASDQTEKSFYTAEIQHISPKSVGWDFIFSGRDTKRNEYQQSYIVRNNNLTLLYILLLFFKCILHLDFRHLSLLNH